MEARIVRETERSQRAELRVDEGDEDPDVRRARRPLRLGGHPLLAEAVEQQLLSPADPIVPAQVGACEESRTDAEGDDPGEDRQAGEDDQRCQDGSHEARIIAQSVMVSCTASTSREVLYWPFPIVNT